MKIKPIIQSCDHFTETVWVDIIASLRRLEKTREMYGYCTNTPWALARELVRDLAIHERTNTWTLEFLKNERAFKCISKQKPKFELTIPYDAIFQLAYSQP